MSPRPWRWPALLLGLSLGGFFDGILLHQVLQWHHLLSNVDAVDDARLQLLADGAFHALMYVIAVIALVGLWRGRSAMTGPGASRWLVGMVLIGFGAWHVIDAVLSHWVLGIHRVRSDSPHPLAWDLLWFAVFGIVPLAGGWLLRRAGGPGLGDGRATAVSLAFTTLLAGAVAASPPGDNAGEVMVMFAPGVSPASAFRALAEADARVLWVDRSGGLWAVKLEQPEAARALYRKGALIVSSSAIAWGCISWSRA
ncbi:DUF2243 domain-containing protein [Piscinibacter sp. HJYY11]|uniref:DUF2243 domain-containing protein n=1 Tax=Piscinibacter sp. HJYY11 TaxID=2801333 RepID=UPI00191E5CC0|nr:DUF2243 domain-containing protein [Piscinibacter sp. HJYY11]MBL0727194.1 DUF2243 domain-containing protein [Piscinibacter sp. HJYY11]